MQVAHAVGSLAGWVQGSCAENTSRLWDLAVVCGILYTSLLDECRAACAEET